MEDFIKVGVDKNCKLSDFGCSKDISNPPAEEFDLLGTPGYQAPEYLKVSEDFYCTFFYKSLDKEKVTLLEFSSNFKVRRFLIWHYNVADSFEREGALPWHTQAHNHVQGRWKRWVDIVRYLKKVFFRLDLKVTGQESVPR